MFNHVHQELHINIDDYDDVGGQDRSGRGVQIVFVLRWTHGLIGGKIKGGIACFSLPSPLSHGSRIAIVVGLPNKNRGQSILDKKKIKGYGSFVLYSENNTLSESPLTTAWGSARAWILCAGKAKGSGLARHWLRFLSCRTGVVLSERYVVHLWPYNNCKPIVFPIRCLKSFPTFSKAIYQLNSVFRNYFWNF